MLTPVRDTGTKRSEQANVHFTYCAPDSADLCQGDLLARTDGLTEVLQQIHRHYTKEEYKYFIVLTQSCDLIRREGPCKAKYVTIAAVRPLSIVLDRELAKHQDETDRRAHVCDEGKKPVLRQFLERLLNNNEPEYFYLEGEAGLRIHDHCAAFLRLSVAVRTLDHYETLLEARIASLAEVFRAKLGWLVGNIYSRVGTEDWVPNHVTRSKFDEKIDDLLKDSVDWIEGRALRYAKRSGEVTSMDDATLTAYLRSTKVPSKKQQVLERVIEVIKTDGILTDQDRSKRLLAHLQSDATISSLFK